VKKEKNWVRDDATVESQYSHRSFVSSYSHKETDFSRNALCAIKKYLKEEALKEFIETKLGKFKATLNNSKINICNNF
jgi:hypothetical protein